MKTTNHVVSIWFFVGVLLAIYGVIILAAGLYGLVNPPATRVVLANLHVDIWWGALLLVIGGIYSYVFLPGRRKKNS
jgi:hypothetical protein